MLYTILMQQDGAGQHIYQSEGEDLNDALGRWADGFTDDKLTEPGRQELVEFMRGLDGDEVRFVSGDDFSQSEYYTNVWTFDTILDLEGESDSGVSTTFLVIKTAKV
jgi:hypothetical protein